MKTITLIICEKCKCLIKPKEGVIIQGNIYAIKENLDERAGIIGNAFPKPDEDGNIRPEDIQECGYHHSCFNSILSENRV